TASDGAGGNVFSVFANNSGATINASTGLYTAGTTHGVSDTVRVTDVHGHTADATVTVNDVLAISPSAPSLAPRQSQSFSGSQGSGTGYSYAISSNNSHGTIDASTGAYTAGSTGGVTDTVTVTDSFNNTANATVTVTAGVSLSPANPSLAYR